MYLVYYQTKLVHSVKLESESNVIGINFTKEKEREENTVLIL